ncbi:carbonyl reductase [Listeria weihenstephanensis FSL R9-0317]|uniref:Carbonyl reductase n=1 Tax=Listeria weihenstephanensis TaxID=1006155 RepID=A0A1S7FWL8_9LIST|nr:SDR family NAD(P)-dependent oxidoreductase [Listeria weihenstephanensis]AQY51789.1 carbonyl reductase [Listeria weihenstephanensis]EUJ41184.1 carbonyl reductase [Listeria weihenstephanensis FSL R9-0317]
MTKKVFITGANKGIGKEIAYQMGKNGWTVLIGARDESRGIAAADELKAKGIDATYVNVDLQSHETITAAANTIKSQHADLTMLINNAGIPGDMRKPGYEFTVDELRPVVETNVFGTFDLTQQLLPVLEANSGRILNMTIPIGMSDFFNPFAYKTSKAALNAMTQSFAQNFMQAGKAVEIFGIMPGGVTTDLNDNMTGDFMKTVPEAGKLITDIIFDGINHNGEIINFNGKVADYNNGLF